MNAGAAMSPPERLAEVRPIANWREVSNSDDGDAGHDRTAGGLAVFREQVIRGADITRIPPPAPLISGVIDRDSVAVFYGAPGAGKSFANVDMACSIAAGIPWHGRAVLTGPVLYVAGEGVAGLGVRVSAWQEYHRSPDISHLSWLPRPINLLDPEAVNVAAAYIAAERPVAVIIDTLGRSMTGGEENSAKDMGRVVEAADRLRRVAGSCIVLVHHLGKDRAAGMRGSNSLEGGVDTAWEVTRESEYLSLNCQRQKNHPTESQPIRLAMANIAGSVVLIDDPRRPADTLHDSIRVTLQVLDDIDTGAGTSTSVWMKSGDLGERTHYRHVKKLLELGLVGNVGTDKQPRYRLTEEGVACLGTATTAK